MTLLRERKRVQTVERPIPEVAPPGRFRYLIVEIVGGLTAAVGGFVYYASVGPFAANVPDHLGAQLAQHERAFGLFGRWWTIGDAGMHLTMGLIVGGCLLMAGGFAATAAALRRRHGWSPSTVTTVLVSVLALAGAVVYGLIWMV